MLIAPHPQIGRSLKVKCHIKKENKNIAEIKKVMVNYTSQRKYNPKKACGPYLAKISFILAYIHPTVDLPQLYVPTMAKFSNASSR